MTKPILVVYATKRESTHEVAVVLASRMRRLGHEVDVRPAAEVGPLRPYGGVVGPVKLCFPFNRMQASDARDWEAIRSWADEIAARFEPLVAV